MKNRADRVAAEIQKELSAIIRSDFKDPRVSGICSIVRVEVTNDFSHAKVYVSSYDADPEKTVEALKNGSGYMRKLLGQRLDLRTIPQLHFVNDDSIEYSVHISQLIDSVNKDKSDE